MSNFVNKSKNVYKRDNVCSKYYIKNIPMHFLKYYFLNLEQAKWFDNAKHTFMWIQKKCWMGLLENPVE